MLVISQQTQASILLFSLAMKSVVASSSSVSIGTYNLWNVMFNWPERFQHIASLITEENIDIVAFQEIRFTSVTADTRKRASQLQELKKYLPNHKWVIAEPAGPVKLPKNAYQTVWNEEGLGILSKFPIKHFKKINFTSRGGRDSNPRLALHAQIHVTGSSSYAVDVVAVHFSYDKQQQCQNAKELLDYLTSQNLRNIIVLGDFNAYPDFSGPVDAFTSKVVASCPFERPQAPLLYDAAKVYSKSADQHLTFSNMPSPGLISRPDRILLSPDIEVIHTDLYGQGRPYYYRCYSSIILRRVMSVLRSAFDSFLGKTGYPCLHDCGPHGSCRCGICVKGGNKLNCDIPDCAECNGHSLILFVLIVFPIVLTLALIGFFIIRTLIMTANFRQEDLFAILGYRCCLFNVGLFRRQSLPRRVKLYLGRASVLLRLPPLPMIAICVITLIFLCLVFLSCFQTNMKFIYAILQEELFPSDHLMVVAKIKPFRLL